MGDKPLVIYHGNCQDGFTAAWACWKANPDWEFYPAKHGDPPPETNGRHVYLLDFSYKRPVMADIIDGALTVTVLDHHKTAEAELKGLDNWYGVFDMDISGARLAWEWFHPEEPVPEIVKYVEDRDLWRFKYEETRDVSAVIFAQPYSFYEWDRIADTIEYALDDVVQVGHGINKKHDKDVAELCQNKYRVTLLGHTVWAVNLPYTLASDAGHLLSKEPGEPFAIIWYYDGKDFIISLRSSETGLDVSEIAKYFGGGGHKHAAGFKQSDRNLLESTSPGFVSHVQPPSALLASGGDSTT